MGAAMEYTGDHAQVPLGQECFPHSPWSCDWSTHKGLSIQEPPKPLSS
jgi:hypothetical protein